MSATAQRPRAATWALVVFGVLVVATVAAFFVTQRLKRGSAVVQKISIPLYISPNGDGRKDVAHISFRLPKADRVTAAMVDGAGDEVRRLIDDRHLSRGDHGLIWNGRDNAGLVPRDGRYYLRVILSRQGRATTAPRGIQLITTPPRPRIVSVTPTRIAPSGHRDVAIRFSGPTSPPPVFSIYRTGDGPARLVNRFEGERNESVGHWDAADARGRPVPPGTYAIAVTVQNRALVAGSAPAKLPPTAAGAARGTGVTVAGAQAAGPLTPTRPGSVARIRLPGVSGVVSYSLRRIGSTHVVRTGRGDAPVLRVGVPERTTTGLYVVSIRTGDGVARAPLAVRGRASGRVLVVLPAIAWQGANPVDDDANGFPDTLFESNAIPTDRPLALGHLPRALRDETAPLLAFLDRRHLRYDLTTDMAMALGQGPRAQGHRGVLFAGSELWLTEGLDRRLRSYVEAGGRVASFGTGAFLRTVTATATVLSDPSPRQDSNVFGESTAPAGSAAAPLVVTRDVLGLFGATDGFVGLFTRFEQERALVGGANVVTAAGRDRRHPAFVAYRLGRGIVVRVGTPQWAAALAGDSEVQAVTRSTWDLLSR
jgi:flagellar hook assembly protein FlgD